MATKTADKFKCPKCGPGRTKPLSMAIVVGTRRRNTVGISRRSMWGSTSTFKSDLVSSLPQRPSNGGAYLCIFLGVCGLLFALFVGSNEKGAEGFAMAIGVVSLLFLLVASARRSHQINWLTVKLVGTDVGCVPAVVISGKPGGASVAQSFAAQKLCGFSASGLSSNRSPSLGW